MPQEKPVQYVPPGDDGPSVSPPPSSISPPVAPLYRSISTLGSRFHADPPLGGPAPAPPLHPMSVATPLVGPVSAPRRHPMSGPAPTPRRTVATPPVCPARVLQRTAMPASPPRTVTTPPVCPARVLQRTAMPASPPRTVATPLGGPARALRRTPARALRRTDMPASPPRTVTTPPLLAAADRHDPCSCPARALRQTAATPLGGPARALPRTAATPQGGPARALPRTAATPPDDPACAPPLRTVATPPGGPARTLPRTAMPPGDPAHALPRTVAMPHHSQFVPLGDDVDGTNKAWTGEKRRRKYLPPSSSDAPATTQHLQDPISHATDIEMEDTILIQEEGDECTGPGVILTKEDQAKYAKILRPNIPPPINPNSYMACEDYDKVEERLARFRITYYKIVKPEAAHELKEPEEYTEDELRRESYFQHLEDGESFEWFFHRDDSQNPELNDYQRIVLRNFLPDSCERLYRYHDDYRSLYHTYEIDSAYVKYYGEISKKLKWIAEYVNLDRSTEKWRNMDTIAWRQALRIATHFSHMTVRLAAFAYNEYIIELKTDASLKDIDLLYFEIWRLVAKEDRRYLDAVKEVYAMDKFAIHKRVLHAELNAGTVFVTIKQMIYSIVKEGGIDLKAKEDEARGVFSKLAFGKHKTMNMAQYAEKKMEIADRLGLDKKEGFVFPRI